MAISVLGTEAVIGPGSSCMGSALFPTVWKMPTTLSPAFLEHWDQLSETGTPLVTR